MRRPRRGFAALTQALAEEVAKDGILVNAVAPSIMDTPANRKAMPKADFAAWPKVEEVAATILFLASPRERRDARRDRAGVREVVLTYLNLICATRKRFDLSPRRRSGARRRSVRACSKR